MTPREHADAAMGWLALDPRIRIGVLISPYVREYVEAACEAAARDAVAKWGAHHGNCELQRARDFLRYVGDARDSTSIDEAEDRLPEAMCTCGLDAARSGQ